MAVDVYEDTIFGQVIPLDWDDEAVTGLALLVDGEEEFIVEPDEMGEGLLELIDRWVTIEGVIHESDSEIRIRVRNYTMDDEIDYDLDDNW
ncbi:hypothetical protein [Pseudodesulfovibrio sediminis]|uniref:Uncharacterized protein n=1 Tax=Pseudodesulfovibrio sediminis TaxID=2810563 RepID=A0ABN6EMZ4_9BACT|nr:hypothetical protein [Pseudodesulfovibrio sediminis]BCS87496.1 hypothetical protein PSDVSF_07380 [Pseudodesulfovibrio sediminis]